MQVYLTPLTIPNKHNLGIISLLQYFVLLTFKTNVNEYCYK